MAAPDGTLVWDLKQKLPGRGTYSCPTLKCVTRSLQAKKLTHHLRQPIEDAATDGKVQELIALCRQNVFNSIKIGIKARKAHSGHTRVCSMLTRGDVQALILASDISASRQHELQQLAEAKQLVPNIFATCRELGELFGVESRSAVALCDQGIAQLFIHQFGLYRTMKEGL